MTQILELPADFKAATISYTVKHTRNEWKDQGSQPRNRNYKK